ncbi:MAG: cysteine hydrolase [Deltaproteobacteria bacterium]|nr:cysteine hydrolase [Deltaproteobacteria bacterium]
MSRNSEYFTEENHDEFTAGMLNYLELNARIRKRIPFTINNLAILIIDLQKEFLHPEGKAFLKSSSQLLVNVTKLINWGRKFSVPVFFTKHAHLPSDSGGMMSKFYRTLLMEGSFGSELIIDTMSNEKVITKNTYDAFYGTFLEDSLRKAGVNRLIISGVLTHLCCETTARSAFVRGFEVFLPVDGTATFNSELHKSSLLGMVDSCVVPLTIRDITSCQR